LPLLPGSLIFSTFARPQPAGDLVLPKFISQKGFRQLLANRFDCAAQPPFNRLMLSAIVGVLILLSIGILAAHAMDVFRSER
jgi:hypothetical protein